MPTVLRVDGYQLIIYAPPREHGPPHVHVLRAGEQIVIELVPVRVARITRMDPRDAIQAVRIVEDNLAMLLAEWGRIHGA